MTPCFVGDGTIAAHMTISSAGSNIELLFTSRTQDNMWKREKMWMIKRKSHLARVCLIYWTHINLRVCFLCCLVCVEMLKCVVSLLAPTEHPKESKYRPVLEVFPFTNTFTLSMKLTESPVLLNEALWTLHTHPRHPFLSDLTANRTKYTANI